MLTRRYALATLSGGCFAAWGFAPGDVWNEKPRDEWPQKDVQRLLTKSPWAKVTAPDMDTGGLDGPGMGGPPMGGPGGMGGPGTGGPGGRGGPFDMEIVVRWESAEPVRLAAKNTLPQDPAGFYVIGVTGFPSPREMGLDEEDLKDTASLKRKGGTAVKPADVLTLEAEEETSLLFYFPAASDPISVKDTEAVFELKVEGLGIKVKFSPKDMKYRGNLAL